MRYRDPAAFRQALEQRLRARAAGDGARLTRDRKRVAFDRLLARLNQAAHGRWLLKGGFALDLRLSDSARATQDMDIDWLENEEELFDGVTGQDHLTTPGILAFAGIEPFEVPVAPLERHVAEKVHAYTRRYGDDRPSSRAKDLIDLVLMSELSLQDVDQLRDAVTRLFEVRATHDLPTSLPPPPIEWTVAYRVLAEEVGLDPDLTAGYRHAAAFLDPALRGEPKLA